MGYLKIMVDVMIIEMNVIRCLIDEVGIEYESIVSEIVNCEGKVIFMGVGKFVYIGKKLVVIFVSIGIFSFFVYVIEVVYGDLGMIESKDIIILILNSGNFMEVVNCIKYIKVIGFKIIVFILNRNLVLVKECDYVLIYFVKDEVDYLNLVLIILFIIILVLGDFIVCVLFKSSNFGFLDFYKYYLGGSLGEKLKIVNNG